MNDHVFFVGIGGSGMNGIARVMRHLGHPVSGSDRDRDLGNRPAFYQAMEAMGIRLYPQDGTGLDSEPDRVVISTAVEARIPDIIRAGELQIPILHRSEALHNLIRPYTRIAVAGTSGKSTVTGMCGWCLQQGHFDPLMINGAVVIGIGPGSTDSDILAGRGSFAVFEADESDRSLTRFDPDIGILTNITLDHLPLADLREIFQSYVRNIRQMLIFNADCDETRRLVHAASGRLSFSLREPSDFRGVIENLSGEHARFTVENTAITLPLPGRHNIENALAAYTLMRHLGFRPPEIRDMLESFRGIERRFQRIGTANGITVIDDFAHNPDKIRSTMRILASVKTRCIYVFQPHGFGPTRFLLDALAEVFATEPRASDQIILTPIFYAGGTVNRDVSSNMLASRICERGGHAEVIDRGRLPDHLAASAMPGDTIIVMGARDPSLPGFCRSILTRIAQS
ncbi:MAG TPA: Mur ligase family protein [bacterium]|nr:Mur ligase family protein [bacterium]